MPIKIVHIIMRWDHSIGGVKRFVFNAVQALDANTFQQAMLPVGRRGNSPIDSRQNEFITIYEPIIKESSAAASDLLFAGAELRRRLKDIRPDIVHIHCNNGLGYLYAQSALNVGIDRRIIHSHNSALGDNGLIKRITHKMLCRRYKDAPTHRIACSQAAGDHLFGSASYEVIHNGIDLEAYGFDISKRRAIRDELGIGDGVVTLGHVGSGIPVKNTEMVLRIALAMKGMGHKVKCLLIGDGDEVSDLKRRACEMGLYEDAHFLGTVTNTCDYYNAMDAFLLPSFYEGLPISLIEAQANGLPCFTSTHVSKEADTTNTVEYLPIENDVMVWAEAIIANQCTDIHRRGHISVQNCETLALNGYSLAGLGVQLMHLYMEADQVYPYGGN